MTTRSTFGFAAEFPPGGFAFVMATGIVSTAAALLGLRPFAVVLFAIALIGFAVLWVLLLARLWREPAAIVRDLRDHRRGPSLLTIVAGTCVVGSQVSLLTPYPEVAAALWIVGCAAWLGLLYPLVAFMTARPEKPPFESGVDGSWLLIVVATEAVAILGIPIAGVILPARAILLASFCCFLLGCLFYAVLSTLIFYRWLFLPMTEEHFAPSYWINMGAAAITALAGASLLPSMAADPALSTAYRFIFTVTMLFWSLATWWIPLLAIMTVWRHRALPYRYGLENWSIVFPLGMYTVATATVSRTLGFAFLQSISDAFVWIAIGAWCLTFAGMVRHLARAAWIVDPASAHRRASKPDGP